QLGLPADFPLTIDEALLKPFGLNDPRLDDLRKANDALYLALLQYEEPPAKAVLADAGRKLRDEFAQLGEVAAIVSEEMGKWRSQVEREKATLGAGAGPIAEDERDSFDRQVKLLDELSEGLRTSRASLADNVDNTEEFLEKLDGADPAAAFKTIRQDLVGRDFRARLSELFVIQPQVRACLIAVNPPDLPLDHAVS